MIFSVPAGSRSCSPFTGARVRRAGSCRRPPPPCVRGWRPGAGAPRRKCERFWLRSTAWRRASPRPTTTWENAPRGCGSRARCIAKKTPPQREAFKGEVAARLEALALDPQRPVRLWVMDEMRCGLHTETRGGCGRCAACGRRSPCSKNMSGNTSMAPWKWAAAARAVPLRRNREPGMEPCVPGADRRARPREPPCGDL